MLDEALERMPHRGRMRLIADIEMADEKYIVCRANDHCGADFPLRIGGVLYGAALAEIGAQAAALHASVHGVGGAHAGLVLSLSNITIERNVITEVEPLIAMASAVSQMDEAAMYHFTVSSGAQPFIAGDLLLSLRRT